MNQYKDQSEASEPETLDAREAAALLGVKPATLYAYVSRGLIESTPGAGGRERRYRRADLEALRERRRGAGAAEALRWGDPVLETAITGMSAEGPIYRGRSAVALATADTPFESVAELLWTGALPDDRPGWPAPAPLDAERLCGLVPADAVPVAWGPVLVAVAAAADPGRFDLRPTSVLARARALVRTLASGLALGFAPERVEAAARAPSVAATVAIALGAEPRPAVARALDRALVVMADHELNASTFAARVVASTRADVYAAVLGGLATLSGPLHGAASDRVEALLAETRALGDARRVVQERDRRGETLPGFGHPFYPDGDPRARVILQAAVDVDPESADLRRLQALAEAMERAGRPAPNVDAALVGLRAALALPRGSAAGLFAVARCAGWVAHALEQYESGAPIRPRARYRPG